MTVIAGPCIISRYPRFFSHFFVFHQQYAVFRHSTAVGHLAVLIEAEGLIPRSSCLTPFACQKIETRPVPCRKGIDADIRISDAATVCIWISVSHDQRHHAAAGRMAPGFCSADAGDNCLFGGGINCDCCVDYTLGTVKGSDPWRHLYKDFLCNIIDKGNVIYLVRHELDYSEIIYGEQFQIVLYYGGP